MSPLKAPKVLAAATASALLLGCAPAAHASGLMDLFSFSADSDYGPSTSTMTLNPPAEPAVISRPPESPMGEDVSPGKPPKVDNGEVAPVQDIGSQPIKPVDTAREKQYKALSREIAVIINERRQAQGERFMRLDPAMSADAQSWAREMSRTHFFQHDPTNRKHGEIIALRYDIESPGTARGFVDQWENSRSHRTLMHDDRFGVMGVGVAHDQTSGEVYAVVRLYYR